MLGTVITPTYDVSNIRKQLRYDGGDLTISVCPISRSSNLENDNFLLSSKQTKIICPLQKDIVWLWNWKHNAKWFKEKVYRAEYHYRNEETELPSKEHLLYFSKKGEFNQVSITKITIFIPHWNISARSCSPRLTQTYPE